MIIVDEIRREMLRVTRQLVPLLYQRQFYGCEKAPSRPAGVDEIVHQTYTSVLESICYRKGTGPEYLDSAIQHKIQKRVKLSEDLAYVKMQYNIPVEDAKREHSLMQIVRDEAISCGWKPEIAQDAIKQLIDISKEVQYRRMENG